MTLLASEMPTARILAFSYAQNTAYRENGVLEEFICDRAVDFLDSLSSYRENDHTVRRPASQIPQLNNMHRMNARLHSVAMHWVGLSAKKYVNIRDSATFTYLGGRPC